MRKAPIKTGPDGRFTLPSERVLSFVRWGTWDSIPLALEREGYHRCQTNFPAATLLATNTPDGAPWLDTGDILLVPRRP